MEAYRWFDRLLIGFFLSNLDVTIVSSSLTSITDSLEGFEKRSWIITGYLATYTGTAIMWLFTAGPFAIAYAVADFALS